MEIKILSKNVYGNDLLYPNCDTSRLLAKLARKKTLDISDLMTIKQLGYKISISGHYDASSVAALV